MTSAPATQSELIDLTSSPATATATLLGPLPQMKAGTPDPTSAPVQEASTMNPSIHLFFTSPRPTISPAPAQFPSLDSPAKVETGPEHASPPTTTKSKRPKASVRELRSAQTTVSNQSVQLGNKDRTISSQGRRISELVCRIDTYEKILFELGWDKEWLEYAAAHMERGKSAKEVIEDVETLSGALA